MLETAYVVTYRWSDGSGSGATAAFIDKARADSLLKVLDADQCSRVYKIEAVPFDSTAALQKVCKCIFCARDILEGGECQSEAQAAQCDMRPAGEAPPQGPSEPVAMVIVREGAEDEFFWSGKGALLELPPGEYDLYLAAGEAPARGLQCHFCTRTNDTAPICVTEEAAKSCPNGRGGHQGGQHD